jgi:hypothetical protein
MVVLVIYRVLSLYRILSVSQIIYRNYFYHFSVLLNVNLEEIRGISFRTMRVAQSVREWRWSCVRNFRALLGIIMSIGCTNLTLDGTVAHGMIFVEKKK